MAAKAAGVPCYVLADSSKISYGPVAELAHPGGSAHTALGEEKDALEVTSTWQGIAMPAPVAVRNVYFESTPLELATMVVTEEGALDLAGVQSKVESFKQQCIDAFQLQ